MKCYHSIRRACYEPTLQAGFGFNHAPRTRLVRMALTSLYFLLVPHFKRAIKRSTLLCILLHTKVIVQTINRLGDETLIGVSRRANIALRGNTSQFTDILMRYALSLLFAVCLAAPSLARADGERPVLVELYTSQGCSSCPPADAFLRELSERRDVIALALHVDYWDYIFDDTFGKAAFTQRQYGYAAAGGRKMVYTPQMIIDGQEHVVGNRPKDVNALIERHRSAPRAVALNLIRDGGRMRISAKAVKGFDSPLIVQIAHYIPEETVSIDYGENAGNTYTYVNIVTDLVEIGRWNPARPLDMSLPAQRDGPVAIILQHPNQGKVEAAALLR